LKAAPDDARDPLLVMDWVNLYALAVNEENAAGGRVVTAPTNGAAGIIPAVLHYYHRFTPGADDDGVVRFLLTAAAIGTLYKRNASISGAEVGCQGEVGSACSMAAAGLAEVMGGRDALLARLTTFFTEARVHWETADPSAANFPRPYYWHGNEPDINAPFLFAQLDAPELTQDWARWILDTHYSDRPDSVAGNDDGGTLGSWYVFTSLGLYPVPGTDRYVVSVPIFEQARVVVDGHELVIVATGASSRARHARRVLVDGVPLAGWELTHAQLRSAARLEFELE
jgi:hypothetical protein